MKPSKYYKYENDKDKMDDAVDHHSDSLCLQCLRW